MLKNISQLESLVAGKVYRFICDADSPIADVKEALFQALKFVGKVEDDIKAVQAAAAPSAQSSSPQDPAKVPDPNSQPKANNEQLPS